VACAGTLNYVLAYRRLTGIKKVQIKYFILVFVFGFSGGLTNFLPVFHLDIYPYGNFLLPTYPIIFTYAILRYRLMDIDFVIKKGMVYSLSAGILASFFVVLVLTMTKYVENVAGMTSHIITIIAALTIAVLFNPLKNRVQKIIDKTFYKRTYNYFEVIREISRKLTTIFEPEAINEFIANTIFDTFGLNSIYVLTAAPGRNCEIVYQRLNKFTKMEKLNIAEQGDLTHNSEIISFMIESEDILIKDELPAFESKIGQNGIERIRRELELFGGEAAAPVFIEGQLSMFLILGEKLSGDMFTREDINLLNTISDQTAIAVKNAGLYKDKLNSEKLASIGMMSATFAHEVRNPLTSLKTFAQLMPEKYNDEEFRDGFSKIVVGEIQKIDDLISDLLDFSEEKKTARLSEYNLVGIVDETINYVKGKLGLARKNIVIEKKYAQESVIMLGDVKQLRQLFTNLVTNGCQAMNGEGTLRIEINPDGENVNVAITDTGQGISLNDIEKIFDPFVTNKETGTGLGLPISKKIVEEHNGSLHVESTLSEGATFTVTLPVQKK
jgi:signal transduction histidine kinase